MRFVPDSQPGGIANGSSHSSGAARLAGWWRWCWAQLREFHATQVEMHERLWLLNQPWQEEYLHWAQDGRLHGSRVPPRGSRRPSVTRTGWCPGLRIPPGDAASRH